MLELGILSFTRHSMRLLDALASLDRQSELLGHLTSHLFRHTEEYFLMVSAHQLSAGGVSIELETDPVAPIVCDRTHGRRSRLKAALPRLNHNLSGHGLRGVLRGRK